MSAKHIHFPKLLILYKQKNTAIMTLTSANRSMEQISRLKAVRSRTGSVELYTLNLLAND